MLKYSLLRHRLTIISWYIRSYISDFNNSPGRLVVWYLFRMQNNTNYARPPHTTYLLKVF